MAEIAQSVENPETGIRSIRRVYRSDVPRHADEIRMSSVVSLDSIEGETARRGSLTEPLSGACTTNDDYLIGTHT